MNFSLIYSKIETKPTARFSVSDEDGDLINFSSNEELVEALNQIKDNVFRIYISRPANLNYVVHENVVCDGCQQQLRGSRYKCTVCPDYDLCSRCEFNGMHNEHDMMCVRKPVPSGDWVFWHNFANASSQERGTEYQMGPDPRHGWPWRCRNRLWKKAWKCHQRLQRQNSRESMQAASPSVPDKVNEQASVESDLPADGLAPHPKAVDQREFLKSMSEAVQSMLNPFGIDVSFSLPDDIKETCEKNEKGDDESTEVTKEPPKSPSSSQAPEKGDEPRKEAPPPSRPQAMNVDLDSNPDTPDPQRTAEFIVIDPDDEEATPRPAPAPKVALALEQMKRMGFNDTGGWLTALLSEHDGNIDRVLDEIQRKCHQV